ncbi:hypothetical protein BJ508DRAFT_314675 [Ascobolus immersus RN42]|uniref:Uncharacterized protein n=1 Tax=Ascobolus immersus RN42 TaxID=1160509 RepID=A0A3N4HE75_ASCIM|nr:hypothetical protein BJ508DRAFT_314675 [Ascobolus immersus RN42]
MPALRHEPRTIQWRVNPYPADRPKKSYRRRFNQATDEWEVETKVTDKTFIYKEAQNTQINAQNAANNFRLGNDDPITPYMNTIEGQYPPAGMYPPTKRAVDLWTPMQWELLGRFYNFNWNPYTAVAITRDEWRGLTLTFMLD